MAGTAFAFAAGMPIREFTDTAGVRWRVWSTVPYTAGVLRRMREGWLTFESPKVRRRLMPIPDGWEDASATLLEEWCQDAEDVLRTPRVGMRPVDDQTSW